MAYPTIVFCHGCWHNIQIFRKVIAILEPLGYKCIAVPLPSSGRAFPNIDQDIAAIRTVVLKELDEGRDVVINAHSWGSIPASTALEGLTKPERSASGKTTAVIKMTYVAAFVIPEGFSLQDVAGGPQPDWIVAEDGTMDISGDHRELFYHDVDPKEADEFLAMRKPQSLASLTTRTTFAAWKKIPSAYLVTEDDRVAFTPLQDMIVGKMREAGAEVEVSRVFSSHSPYLVKPDFVADFLKTAIGKV